jgi:phage shock protein PspC (stress-responsive transcriptional regulator)
MRQVITIELNGHLYQLDETGYGELRAYLLNAGTKLGANPDRAEIVRDLEQSIGEKLSRYLGPDRSVVAAAEVAQILAEIGPIEGPGVDAAQASANASGSSPTAPTATKRLYLIRDGAMLAGVCNGIAAYFTMDPAFVRVAFVVAAVAEMAYFDRPPVVSIGLYAVLMFLVPYAPPVLDRGGVSTDSQPFARKVQRGVERVKAAFGGLHRNAH